MNFQIMYRFNEMRRVRVSIRRIVITNVRKNDEMKNYLHATKPVDSDFRDRHGNEIVELAD